MKHVQSRHNEFFGMDRLRDVSCLVAEQGLLHFFEPTRRSRVLIELL